jgi:cytidylate kinase
MNTQVALDKCVPFLRSELSSGAPAAPSSQGAERRLVVTISRQSGSGAHAVANRLAEYLQSYAPRGSPPWRVFDRNLVEQVLEDHNLPTRYARFMPEDRTSELADVVEELLGAHPPSWTFVRQTAETILRLAQEGNVILIGREANLITRNLDYAFHVRLVGSLEKRVEHFRDLQGLGRQSALQVIRREDRGRRRCLKKYFDKDLDDPMLYHLVINTDFGSYEKVACLIGEAVLNSFERKAAA